MLKKVLTNTKVSDVKRTGKLSTIGFATPEIKQFYTDIVYWK